MNWFVWSPNFSGGNRRFLTKRLWGSANEPPYFHHGLFTTLRQAVLAHDGEALAERRTFQALSQYDQDSLIEFLKTLQVLPPGTKHLIVDDKFQPREWPQRSQRSDGLGRPAEAASRVVARSSSKGFRGHAPCIRVSGRSIAPDVLRKRPALQRLAGRRLSRGR